MSLDMGVGKKAGGQDTLNFKIWYFPPTF